MKMKMLSSTWICLSWSPSVLLLISSLMTRHGSWISSTLPESYFLTFLSGKTSVSSSPVTWTSSLIFLPSLLLVTWTLLLVFSVSSLEATVPPHFHPHFLNLRVSPMTFSCVVAKLSSSVAKLSSQVAKLSS